MCREGERPRETDYYGGLQIRARGDSPSQQSTDLIEQHCGALASGPERVFIAIKGIWKCTRQRQTDLETGSAAGF
jgi:hypothetical protein